MKLQSARWSSWLCLGHNSYVTPCGHTSCVCVDVMRACACVCVRARVIHAGCMCATVFRWCDDADTVICFCHLSEQVRERVKEQWRILVYVRMETHEWNWSLWAWLIDETFVSSLTHLSQTVYSFSVGWLSLRDTECLRLCVMWLSSYHVTSVRCMQGCHSSLKSHLTCSIFQPFKRKSGLFFGVIILVTT